MTTLTLAAGLTVALGRVEGDFDYFDRVKVEIGGHLREGADDERFPVIPQRLVADGRRVPAIAGDGGFMMNSQEPETTVRLGLDLVVLMVSDGSYGRIRSQQQVAGFADRGLAFGNPDFVRHAESYGAAGPAGWRRPVKAVMVPADDSGRRSMGMSPAEEMTMAPSVRVPIGSAHGAGGDAAGR